MLWQGLKQWLNGLSAKAILQRMDKRRQQNVIDTHRLYLLTNYWWQRQKGVAIGDGYADALAKEAEELGFEGQLEVVQDHISRQVFDMARMLDEDLAKKGQQRTWTFAAERGTHRRAMDAEKGSEEEAAPTPKRGSGLAMAMGWHARAGDRPNGPAVVDGKQGAETGSTQVEVHSPAEAARSIGGDGVVTIAHLSDVIQTSLGYSVCVEPSSIPHSEAGNGLWVSGEAPLGAVVALYPGLVYQSTQYRHIPNYPRVDMSNPYLFARFDGAVIDAKPWGHGQLSLEHAFPEAPQTEAERDLERLQGCHPLAMGHFANHPGKGMRPNVMVAPLDLSFSPTMPNKHRRLRAYIPNLTFYERGTEPRVSDDIMGAVLIALRDLRDEEVFLNYRLTPHVSRPEWYEPVDVEEEWRRWA